MIALGLLGTFELRLDGVPIRLRRTDSMRLVAYIYLRNVQVQSRGYTAHMLWPDTTEAAAAARLRQAIHWLGTDLSTHGLPLESLLISTSRTIERPVQSDVDVNVDVDVVGSALQRAAHATARGDAAAATGELEASLDLWRGDLLEGWHGEWIELRRAELRRLHAAALTSHARASAVLLRFDRARESVDAAIALDDAPSLVTLRNRIIAALAGGPGDARPTYGEHLAAFTDSDESTAAADQGDHADRSAPSPSRAGAIAAGPSDGLMRAPLIARASSLRQVIDLVQRHAVVTLVGPPGVGKSALAAHAFTALAPGIDGDSRWSDIAERPLDQPAPTRGRDLLIAIDNADAQRSSWLPIVEEVLRRDGSARLLCTARSALGIDGEIVCPVPTLDRPASLALLRELVPLSTPIEDLDIIASAFDGLPLGLALAAEAVNLRGIADVLTRIADRPDLLSGDPAVVRSVRHRNLATAISGSWAGLTPAAQTLLCRLSSGGGDHALADVFAAAADLDAAPAETLRLLVHYSLLATCDRADNGPRTYRVPRPIATYALGRAAG